MILYDFPIRTSIYRGLSIATFDDRSVYFMNIQRIVPKWIDADRWVISVPFSAAERLQTCAEALINPKEKVDCYDFPILFLWSMGKGRESKDPQPTDSGHC